MYVSRTGHIDQHEALPTPNTNHQRTDSIPFNSSNHLAGEVVEELALDVVQRRGELQLRLFQIRVCV